MPPPLPPRKAPPPLPNRRPSSESEPMAAPTGIAARIASLQLEQIGRSPLARPPIPDKVGPPPIPAVKRPPPLPPSSTRPKIDSLPARPDLGRALSRPVPPPPLPREEIIQAPVVEKPVGGGRRLPPMASRLPTPPPERKEEQEQPEYREDCIKCRDFSHVDGHAAVFPRESVQSVANLAYDLTEPFEYETEKARAIFTWMHHNIAYDTVSFLSGNLRPSTGTSTLRSGLAVCDGYSVMFKELAECVGLQVYVASGHGKGFGYAPLGPDEPIPKFSAGHAWNCVLMDGEWHAIDACWGAGALDGSNYVKRFTPDWFTCDPFEFARTHHPTEPLYQLITEENGGPVSWEDYITAPEKPTLFSALTELDFTPHTLEPATKYIYGGEMTMFRISKRCEHLSRRPEDNYVYFINTGKDTRTVMEVDDEGFWTAEVYVPRGEQVSLYYVTEMDGRDAKGMGNPVFVNSIGRRAMAFGGIVRWTAVE